MTIGAFCNSESLPPEYMDEIKEYQSKGYRVLAYGTKLLEDNFARSFNDIINLPREQAESEDSFQFLGIVVMDN